jgi:hypothetical protein
LFAVIDTWAGPSIPQTFDLPILFPHTGNTAAMDGPKTDIGHHEVLHDVDIIGEKHIDAEQAMHLRVLTPDELIAEKKLRTKIDKRIMPVVVTVYLLNYIDRWVECHTFLLLYSTNLYRQEQLRCSKIAGPGGRARIGGQPVPNRSINLIRRLRPHAGPE